MQAHFQHCLELIKPTDHYSPILFLPEKARPYTSAIYAFSEEIEKIPFIVNEPMMGEVRLQWWVDIISGERAGEAQANPISKALLETIEQFDLSIVGFTRYLEAKLFDLYNDPMPDTETFEAYCGETHSFLLQSIATILGAENSTELADACGHSGVAIGTSEAAGKMPIHSAKQQVYLPRTILEQFELNTTYWLADEYTDRHKTAFREFCQQGLQHHSKAIGAIKLLDKQYHQTFLSLSYAKLGLIKMSKHSADPRAQTLSISRLSKQWSLWKTAAFGP